MIWLEQLARLADRHSDDLEHPVRPLRVGARTIDTDREPVLMGVVNLSRDSAYRESIAVSTASALRKAQVAVAEGAHVVDVGAESSRPSAADVDPEAQLHSLRPAVEAMVDRGVTVSVESYSTEVARVGLTSGATVLNLTGSGEDDAMFALAAEHEATVILCHIRGIHARALDGTDVQDDPFEEMLDTFGRRLERATELGVPSLAVDPGIGFGFRMHDPAARARYQATTLVNSFRLRQLGAPVCHSLPHAFDVFEEQFRTAEGFFAVLAKIGGTGVFRTHEVPRLRAVLDAMSLVSFRD